MQNGSNMFNFAALGIFGIENTGVESKPISVAVVGAELSSVELLLL